MAKTRTRKRHCKTDCDVAGGDNGADEDNQAAFREISPKPLEQKKFVIPSAIDVRG
jgi:hypothetical protein